MTEDSPDTLILVRPQEPYVCVGYHQPLSAVLDRAACDGAGLPIVRRRVVGNILLDFDYEMMARVWRVPSEDFRRFAYQAMQRRITTLWSRLPQPISTDEVQACLAEEYPLALNRPVVPGSPTEAEQAKVAEMEEQLLSEEWLHLLAQVTDEPMRTLKISLDAFVHAEEAWMTVPFIGGTFFARNDVIEQAIFTSDLPEKKRQLIENRLVGVPLKHWREVVEPLAVIP